jgi:hypothetical protein
MTTDLRKQLPPREMTVSLPRAIQENLVFSRVDTNLFRLSYEPIIMRSGDIILRAPSRFAIDFKLEDLEKVSELVLRTKEIMEKRGTLETINEERLKMGLMDVE